jgi:uncharacterized protein (DUF924 family)
LLFFATAYRADVFFYDYKGKIIGIAELGEDVRFLAMNENDVIDFWFGELRPADWWKKDTNLDRLIKHRFLDVHAAASRCELYPWRARPHGRLAEIIVLDQFSRNISRGTARAFQYDSQALCLAQEAIAAHAPADLDAQQKAFLYMPFMHSESPKIHEWALELFGEPGLEWQLEFELKHKVIIDRFGRYPHRNETLGRQSTPEELRFLQESGSSF